MTDLVEQIAWINESPNPASSIDLNSRFESDHPKVTMATSETNANMTHTVADTCSSTNAVETAPQQPEEESRVKFYDIVLEEDLPPEERDESREEQIYYFPLAIGKTSMKTANEKTSCQPPSKERCGTLLRELGRSLSQSNDNEQEDCVKQPSATEDPDKNICGVFLNPGATLITNRLLKSGTIPDSITQQFNEIAKFNKNNVRSKRTVRTTTTRLVPSTCSSTKNVSTPKTTTGTSQESKDEAKPSKPIYIQTEQKYPYHARFHSDETTILSDYSLQSPFSSTSKRSNESPVTPSTGSTSTTPAVRQPMTYFRSATAERLPMFGRSMSGVLRSKSSVSATPRERYSAGVPTSSGTSAPVRAVCSYVTGHSPASGPESALSSQRQSGTNPDSTEGSTNSLPSLSTGGSPRYTLDPTEVSQPITESSAFPTNPLATEAGSTLDAEDETNQGALPPEQAEMVSQTLKRRHIMKELIQVEKDYVSALATLVNAYLIPLRLEKILDDQQVDVIFFKVNDLYNYHMSFLNTLQMWELTNTVGDKLLDMFSREAVASCYCSFVENFPNSEKALETCWNTKSSFQKFCEQRLRTLRSKLPLKALLVQPIQRIPRYELLVNRLIEHTPKEYSDSALLMEAKAAIHHLAVRVNAVRADGQDEGAVDGIKLLERLLAPATLTPNRAYIRHDIVSMEDRKDPVCIYTFTDQIVFTVAKRRGSQVMKKPLFLKLQSPKGVDSIENIKYKIFHRLAIEAIDLERCGENDTERLVHHRELRDKKDLALLAEIEKISGKLDYRHQDLDTVVRQLYQSVQQELEDLRNARNDSTEVPKNLSVFSATTKEGIERYELTFPTLEKRTDWERTVLELKRQLSTVKRTSKFHTTVEITPTLSGIQLSCAAAIELTDPIRPSPRDIWICAADGYTGYICLLALSPTPLIQLNAPLSGCNSRITCICSVPGFALLGSRRISAFGSPHRSAIERARSRRQRSLQLSSKDLSRQLSVRSSLSTEHCRPTDLLDESEITTTPNTTAEGTDKGKESPTLQQDEGSSTLQASPPNTPIQTSAPQIEPPLEDIKEQTRSDRDETEGCTPEDVCADDMGDVVVLNENQDTSENTESSDASDGEQDTPEETTSSSTNNQTSNDLPEPNVVEESATDERNSSPAPRSNKLADPHRPTMWIGTEDGTIFVYYATDNIRTTRQRHCLHLSSAITSILHLDTRIFVSCANGDFLVYDRHPDGLWNFDTPRLINITSDGGESVVVRRMLAVVGNVWCAAHRFIYVINSVTLKVELSFPLNGNPADPRGIQQMAYGNQTVWLATDNSSRISLYHATTGEFLMEIDLKPVVLQSLQHCDEIIKRHKEACLRITCMTVCKDLLWVGTSAGLIVTVTIPRVHLSSEQSKMEQPQLEILKQGHIGHVRFLISLESSSGDEGTAPPAHTERPPPALSTMLETIPSVQTETSDLNDIREESTMQQVTPQITIKTNEPDPKGDGSPPKPTMEHTPGIEFADAAAGSKPTECKLSTIPPITHHRHALLGVRRASVNPCVTIATQMKVISGGDGYEEYVTGDRPEESRDPNLATATGDKDSYSYILIWDMS